MFKLFGGFFLFCFFADPVILYLIDLATKGGGLC